MGSSVITPEDVLETLMNDGTIDTFRLKIVNQLKANEELKNNTITMVEQSKVLNTPGAEKQTKRELFDALRRELETPVLEKASKAVWDLILDNNGLGKEISDTVEGVFCRLSGRELPPHLAPAPAPVPVPPAVIAASGDIHPENEKEAQEETDKMKEVEMSDEPSSRKRNFAELNSERAEEVPDSSDRPPVASDGAVPPLTITMA